MIERWDVEVVWGKYFVFVIFLVDWKGIGSYVFVYVIYYNSWYFVLVGIFYVELCNFEIYFVL